eukprot:TRINITY_DN10281_c0_g1_i2.p1 TRINITY_DN10281_c0_g1~~TRINITY_DN10281_c0_g1_i2.p1  ORF type:complete len:192 (-),score=28.36 TRINITY_DN10281_c0_g1_i2:88-663(-)
MGDSYSKVLPLDCSSDGPLYLGNIEFLVDGTFLKELGIQAIVTAMASIPDELPATLEQYHISPSDHMCCPLEDNSDSFVSLFDAGIEAVLEFFHRCRLQGKPVLVYCDAGLTRSAAVVAVYLMSQGFSYSSARAHLFEVRDEHVNISLFDEDLEIFDKRRRRLHATSPACGSDGPPCSAAGLTGGSISVVG